MGILKRIQGVTTFDLHTFNRVFSQLQDNITTALTQIAGTSGSSSSWAVESGVTFSGFGTVSNVQLFSKTIGDTYFLRGSFTAGTTTSVTASINIPNTINFKKIPSNSTGQAVGIYYEMHIPGTGISFYTTNSTGAIFSDGSTTGSLFMTYDTSSNNFQKNNGNSLINTGENVVLEGINIPIS